MLKTATQVMIMSCLRPFNLGRRKPWRWPWTTAARLKQNNTTTTGEKKKVFVLLEFSHLAFSVQGNKSCASLGQLITPAHSYDMLLYKIQMLCPFPLPCKRFKYSRRQPTGSYLTDPSELLLQSQFNELNVMV